MKLQPIFHTSTDKQISSYANLQFVVISEMSFFLRKWAIWDNIIISSCSETLDRAIEDLSTQYLISF